MLDVTYVFTSEIKEWLAQLDTNLKAKDKVASAFGAIIYGDIMQHFSQQMEETGKWQAWSDSYAAFMKRIGKSGNKILQDNGNLRQGVKPANYRFVEDGIMWYNDAQTEGGFPYAYAHDNLDGGRKQLPRRGFMWVSPNKLNVLAKALLDQVINKL